MRAAGASNCACLWRAVRRDWPSAAVRVAARAVDSHPRRISGVPARRVPVRAGDAIGLYRRPLYAPAVLRAGDAAALWPAHSRARAATAGSRERGHVAIMGSRKLGARPLVALLISCESANPHPGGEGKGGGRNGQHFALYATAPTRSIVIGTYAANKRTTRLAACQECPFQKRSERPLQRRRRWCYWCSNGTGCALRCVDAQSPSSETTSASSQSGARGI